MHGQAPQPVSTAAQSRPGHKLQCRPSASSSFNNVHTAHLGMQPHDLDVAGTCSAARRPRLQLEEPGCKAAEEALLRSAGCAVESAVFQVHPTRVQSRGQARNQAPPCLPVCCRFSWPPQCQPVVAADGFSS